jgi:hypothetical protein
MSALLREMITRLPEKTLTPAHQNRINLDFPVLSQAREAFCHTRHNIVKHCRQHRFTTADNFTLQPENRTILRLFVRVFSEVPFTMELSLS